MTNKEYERLAGKLYKVSLDIDRDAARVNGDGKTKLAEQLRDIAADMRNAANFMR